jgi:hypothetical protein
MAHDIEGDFQKAIESYPMDVDNKEMNLERFAKKVNKYAKQLGAILKARTTSLDKASTKAASSEKTAKVMSNDSHRDHYYLVYLLDSIYW